MPLTPLLRSSFFVAPALLASSTSLGNKFSSGFLDFLVDVVFFFFFLSFALLLTFVLLLLLLLFCVVVDVDVSVGGLWYSTGNTSAGERGLWGAGSHISLAGSGFSQAGSGIS